MNLLRKLIRDGSDKVRIKANLSSMAIGSALIFAGFVCAIVKPLVEREGEPDTVFFLLPVGALLIFCGVVAFVITGLRNMIELLRSREPSVRCDCLSVALRCGSVTMGYLAMIMFLIEANSNRHTLSIFLCCVLAAAVSAAASVLLKAGAVYGKE